MTKPAAPNWDKLLAPYKKADDRIAFTQLADTAIPFVALWALMLWTFEVSYLLTLALAIPAALLQIRLFIFQHDCGHGSFFSSRRANNVLGFVLGILTFMPYHYWRRTHAIHHATAGNLDRRELGDISTLTVREYLALSPWRRFGYRLYRNPLVLLLIGPFYQFVLKHRLPLDAPWSWTKEWRGVMATNLAIVAAVVAMGETFGWGRFLAIEMPVLLISGGIGIWLFYVQHQFEDTYWEGREHWKLDLAALHGSSFLDLPAVLHWFTGNIGYHHVHHLSSQIPNYRLRRCMEEVSLLQHVTRISFLDGLRCLRLKLWDEEGRQLVGFDHLASAGR